MCINKVNVPLCFSLSSGGLTKSNKSTKIPNGKSTKSNDLVEKLGEPIGKYLEYLECEIGVLGL